MRVSDMSVALGLPVALGFGFLVGLAAVIAAAATFAGAESPARLSGMSEGVAFALVVMTVGLATVVAGSIRREQSSRPPPSDAAWNHHVARAVHDAASPADLPEPRLEEAA